MRPQKLRLIAAKPACRRFSPDTGHDAPAMTLEEGVALVLRRREEGMRLKDAVRAVADDTGLSRNALYDAALKNLA